ncbi:pilus assembly protein PilM [Candidatus Ozemobacteraceae bacterium]|nr:pilus assembly protein PilM [Candidatus Ozemobacteraceae bacterium]
MPQLKAVAHLPIPAFTHLLTAEEKERMSRDDIEKDAQVKLQRFLTKHLTELLYDNQIQTKRGITLASGRSVTIRYFEIPPIPEKNAFASAVKAEAAKQMPFSMENAVLGYSNIGETVKEEKALAQVMVAALQKDVAQLVSDNFKGGGLTNEGILTLPQTLELSLASQLKPPPGREEKVAVIHCGHKTTSVLIYKNGILNFYRDINMGGETITESILAGGDLDGAKIEFKSIEEATELKHKIGILPPDELQNLKGVEKFAAKQIFASVEKIFQHIQLSISFYISQLGETGIDRAILSGGSAAMKNFREFIEESLEIPVELANPFKDLSTAGIAYSAAKLQAEAPQFAAPVGVALYDGSSSIINFTDILFPNRHVQTLDLSKVSSKFGTGIAKKFGFNLELDEKKVRLIAALLGVLYLLLLLIPVVKIRQDVSAVKTEYQKLQNKLGELTSSQNEVTELLAEKDRLTKEIGFPDEVKKLRFPNSQILLEIASITPKQIFIQELVISRQANPATFKITGQTDSSDRVFDYIRYFENATFLKSPAIESTEEVPIDDKKDFIKFALSGNIVIPPPDAAAANAAEGN